MAFVQAKYEHGQLTVFMQKAALKLTGGGDSRRILGEGIRDGAERVRQRAVRNVSGFPVSYEGRMFRVSTVTGALKAAIETEWPYGDVLSARVYVNGAHTSVTNIGGYQSKPTPVGRYAAAVEFGHGPIDLKKTMMGKTVPFFGARAMDAQGPYAATGLHQIPQGPNEGLYTSTRLNRKLAKKGKRPMNFERKGTASGGAYFIAFRKVGKTGWIIPEAQPRPFMAAAAKASEDDLRRIIGGKLNQLLSER